MDFVLSIGIMMLASSDEKETDAKRARKKANISVGSLSCQERTGMYSEYSEAVGF